LPWPNCHVILLGILESGLEHQHLRQLLTLGCHKIYKKWCSNLNSKCLSWLILLDAQVNRNLEARSLFYIKVNNYFTYFIKVCSASPHLGPYYSLTKIEPFFSLLLWKYFSPVLTKAFSKENVSSYLWYVFKIFKEF